MEELFILIALYFLEGNPIVRVLEAYATHAACVEEMARAIEEATEGMYFSCNQIFLPPQA